MSSLTKRDLFNARNAGNKLESGLTLTVVAVGQFEDTDRDGKPVKVSVLKDNDGTVYTTISGTIADSLNDLGDIIDDEGKVEVTVVTKKSQSGREFFQLQII